MAVGRQVTREAGIYVVGFFGAAFLQFLAVPLYTRYLGPDEYAKYALTQAVTASLAGLLLLGGDVALSRFWFDARTERERRDLSVTWIGFLTLWSIAVVGVFAAFVNPLSQWISTGGGLAPLLLVGLVTLVPAQLSRMLAQVLRNEFRPIPFAITTVLLGALSMTLGLACGVVGGLGPLGILAGALAAELLVCVARWPLVRGALRGTISLAVLRAPLRFGAPLVPASLAMWAFTGADKIVVGRYVSPTELGAYSAAAVLVAPFGLLLVALAQAWIPRVSQLYESSPPRAQHMTGRAIELSLAGFGVAAAVLGLVAEPLITVFAGSQYQSGAVAIPCLALGSAFLGVGLFTQTGSTLAKRTALIPAITVLAALVDVALLVALVPRGGLVGAAVAVLAGYFLLALGTLGYSLRCMPIEVRLMPCLAMCLLLATSAMAQTRWPGSPVTLCVTAATLVVLTWLGLRALPRQTA